MTEERDPVLAYWEDNGKLCNLDDCQHFRQQSEHHPYGSTTAAEDISSCELLEHVVPIRGECPGVEEEKKDHISAVEKAEPLDAYISSVWKHYPTQRIKDYIEGMKDLVTVLRMSKLASNELYVEVRFLAELAWTKHALRIDELVEKLNA